MLRSSGRANCVFENCRGFALESVDGGPIEDYIHQHCNAQHLQRAAFFSGSVQGCAPPGIGVGTFRVGSIQVKRS